MDFFQLLQLNFKNVVMICKFFLTAIIVSIWTKNALSFQDIFSVGNVSFFWNFLLVYLLFYLLISAGFGLFDKGLFELIKMRAKSKGIELDLGKDVVKAIEKGNKILNTDLFPRFGKLIINHDTIVNVSGDLCIIFIQIAIVMRNFWFYVPTVIIALGLPFFIASLHYLNEYYKHEHNRGNREISN